MTWFIAQLHADLRSQVREHRGALNKADPISGYTQGTHKTYERMPKVVLPEIVPTAISLAEAITSRRSYDLETEGSVEPLSLQAISNVLGGALRVKTEKRRMYPSGGGLFPIETYLVASLGKAPLHAYHYNPTQHTLEDLWPADNIDTLAALTYESLLCGAVVLFTAVWDRSSQKYGDFAYTLAQLEAGHMAQNLLLCAGVEGLLARPLVGFNDEKMVETLDFDKEKEQPVYAVALSV